MNYQHKEAFCLMLYQGERTKRVLDIWNSRDGVTPFGVTIDGDSYRHIAFNFDRCVPGHELRPGDYFFRDMTRTEAERIAAIRIDNFYPKMTDREREAVIAEWVEEIGRFGSGPAPYLDRAPFIAATQEHR